MTVHPVAHQRWAEVPAEQLTPFIHRQYITAEHVTIARFELKAGGVVARHAHDNEQVSCVLTGRLRFQFPGGAVDVGPGELVQIPGGIEHEVQVIEDALVMDVFSPVRQDWVNRTDTYFRR